MAIPKSYNIPGAGKPKKAQAQAKMKMKWESDDGFEQKVTPAEAKAAGKKGKPAPYVNPGKKKAYKAEKAKPYVSPKKTKK